MDIDEVEMGIILLRHVDFGIDEVFPCHGARRGSGLGTRAGGRADGERTGGRVRTVGRSVGCTAARRCSGRTEVRFGGYGRSGGYGRKGEKERRFYCRQDDRRLRGEERVLWTQSVPITRVCVCAPKRTSSRRVWASPRPFYCIENHIPAHHTTRLPARPSEGKWGLRRDNTTQPIRELR